jgi:phenylalanyl-tRNA synthetase alpha chain
MPKINLKLLKKRAQSEIKKAQDLKGLNEVFNKYLGKKGKLTLILRSLEKLPKAKKKKIGSQVNKLKDFLKIKFNQRATEIKEKIEKETEVKEWFDISLPGKRPSLGHLHPLTQVKRKIEEIFQSMGFSVVEGPEIETEWYNFDALNIPKEHPIRDIFSFGKTFYLKDGNLMRTHTSAVQIHYLEENQPPLRIIVPGRVFRYEATDISHDFEFWHIEGLMVGKDISVANFKAIIAEFFKRFFEKEIKIRMRPSYFPFTEPSFEIDITCLNCQGKGCSVCSKNGWLEIMGAGMVHPAVFKNSGLNPKFWQGFAFGLGMDRLAMIKYKINDIRLFRSGDLRFLNQF